MTTVNVNHSSCNSGKYSNVEVVNGGTRMNPTVVQENWINGTAPKDGITNEVHEHSFDHNITNNGLAKTTNYSMFLTDIEPGGKHRTADHTKMEVAAHSYGGNVNCEAVTASHQIVEQQFILPDPITTQGKDIHLVKLKFNFACIQPLNDNTELDFRLEMYGSPYNRVQIEWKQDINKWQVISQLRDVAGIHKIKFERISPGANKELIGYEQVVPNNTQMPFENHILTNWSFSNWTSRSIEEKSFPMDGLKENQLETGCSIWLDEITEDTSWPEE